MLNVRVRAGTRRYEQPYYEDHRLHLMARRQGLKDAERIGRELLTPLVFGRIGFVLDDSLTGGM